MGAVTLVEIAEPTPIATVLDRLREGEPRLKPYLRFVPGDTQARGLLIMRGEETLKLTDPVRPGERVEILAGIQGG